MPRDSATKPASAEAARSEAEPAKTGSDQSADTPGNQEGGNSACPKDEHDQRALNWAADSGRLEKKRPDEAAREQAPGEAHGEPAERRPAHPEEAE